MLGLLWEMRRSSINYQYMIVIVYVGGIACRRCATFHIIYFYTDILPFFLSILPIITLTQMTFLTIIYHMTTIPYTLIVIVPPPSLSLPPVA